MQYSSTDNDGFLYKNVNEIKKIKYKRKYTMIKIKKPFKNSFIKLRIHSSLSIFHSSYFKMKNFY